MIQQEDFNMINNFENSKGDDRKLLLDKDKNQVNIKDFMYGRVPSY